MTKNPTILFLATIGLLAGFFIASAQVFALIGECQVTDPNGAIWYNNVNIVEITCECPPNTTQLQGAYITKSFNKPITPGEVEGLWPTFKYTFHIDHWFDIKKYGTYNIGGVCADADSMVTGTFSGTFDVHQLTGYITSPTRSEPIETYLTNTTSIEYKLFKDESPLTPLSLVMPPNFEIYLGNEGTAEKKIADADSPIYDPAKQSWIIPSYRLDSVSGLTSENTYNLKVRLTYTEPPDTTISLTNTEVDAVRTMKSLVVSLVPGTLPTVLDLTASTKKEVKVRVVYQGEPAENLDMTHFDVYLEREDGERTANLVDLEGFTYNEGDGYYVVPINILQQDPGNYELKIAVWYSGVGEVILNAADVRFVLAFQGQLVDSNGNVVSASIVLKNNETEIPFVTDGTGKYNVPICADTYDIAMRFPEVWRVELTGVEICSNTIDSINYDYFSGNPEIEGLTVAKLVVLEFGLPFEEAYLEIPYAGGAVEKEENIETYECTKWNFDTRKCYGEWREVPSVINIVRDLVSFKTNRLSAFVIGERRGLWLDAALDKEDYFAKERMTLTGKVVDTKSVDIVGVDIYFTVEGTDISGKTTSGDGGIFTAILSAPDDGGTYNIIANAKKSPYISHNMTYKFEVTRKKEVNLQVPETVDIKLNESSTVKLTVFNTGQTELTNVKLSISGLKDTWYKLEPAIFESIPAGERKNVDLNVHIPAEDCESGNCEKYYFVNVDFKSNEIAEKTAFTAKIKTNESFEESVSEPEDAQSFTLPDMTGLVSLASAGKTNMYLSLFFIAAAFVVMTIKKRQRRAAKSAGSRYIRMPKRSAVSAVNTLKARFSRRR